MKMPSHPPSGSVVENQLNSRDLGINIMTRPMGSHSQRESATTLTSDDVIRENPWDIQKWVERPQVIGSYQWNVTDTTSTVLAAYNLPTDIFSASPFFSSPFSYFQYWRGDIQLHLQTSGTPFHLGTLIMYYVPLRTKVDPVAIDSNFNFSTSTTLQHTILHANASTSACMTIPFINPYSYLNVNEEADNLRGCTGTVYIVVMNPLNAATGASQRINVSLFAQFMNSQFKIPRNPAFLAQGLIERVFGTSAGKVIQKMLPRNIIADSIDSALGIVGLDKPTSIERGAPMKMIGTQYLNSSVEIDYLDKFTLFPSVLQETMPNTFSVTNNECEFDFLKKKFSYFGTFSQTISQGPGSVLAQVPLCPVVAPLYTPSGMAPYSSIRNAIPLIEYISLPFNFWKGGLTFKVQVVATSFHNSKIFAAVLYDKYDDAADTTVTNATSRYGFAFEINQGATEFEFTVPYVSQSPQLNIPMYRRTPLPYDAATSMGTLVFYVINELAVSNNVPSTISYNMFVAGADDYSVNTLQPAPFVYAYRPTGVTFEAQSILSTPLSNTDVTDQVENVVVSPSIIQVRTDLNEKSIDSILQPLKKYNLISVYTVSLNSAQDRYFPLCSLFNFPSFVNASYLAPTTYTNLNYFSRMYRGFRGPIRLKFVLMNNPPIDATFGVYFYPPNAAFSTTGAIYGDTNTSLTSIDSNTLTTALCRPNAQVALINSTQKSAEIEIPYTTAVNFSTMSNLSNSASVILSDEQIGTIYIRNEGRITGDPQTCTIQVYCALGDEFKFGVFSGVPSATMQVNSASGAPSESCVYRASVTAGYPGVNYSTLSTLS
jgi:hypothetical protein